MKLPAVFPLTMMLICCLSCIGTTASDKSKATSPFLGVDVDSLVTEITQQQGTGAIGGLWAATTDGAAIGIVPAKTWREKTGIAVPEEKPSGQQLWAMVVTSSPDPHLQPGTLIGWFSPAAKPGYFNARIYSKIKKGKPGALRQFVLHLTDDGHLTMKAIHKGVEVNPWRFLPYMIRGAFKYRNNTPSDLEGFIKIWPMPRNPQSPRYL